MTEPNLVTIASGSDPLGPPPPLPERLASDLASHLGREQGSKLLDLARANLVLQASKPGTTTSEFKLTVLAILTGLVLVGLGASQPEHAALLDHGLQLIQWSTVGYGISRGISKVGATKPQ